MIVFRYSYYLLVSALLAVVVLSFPQLPESTLRGISDWAVNPGAVSNDAIDGIQGSLIASGDLQGQNLWHSDSDFLSQLGEYDTNILPDEPKDSVALFDGNDGVTNVVPQTFPSPLRIFFPDGLPKFDPEGVIRWFTEPKEPSCDDGKFAFCCQMGPPAFQQRKNYPTATDERKQEVKRRLRKCRNWKADDPACFFPENQACCDCKSESQIAFECYNPNWRNDPDFQGTSQRQPVLLPKLNAPSPDPNPSEPNSEQLGGEKRKREWSSQLFDNKEINTGVTVDMPGMDDMLYAAKYQSPYLHPGGRDRLESTCSDDYLAARDVPSNRYYRTPVHSPAQPFIPKIDRPKPPDRRFNINKPKPNSD